MAWKTFLACSLWLLPLAAFAQYDAGPDGGGTDSDTDTDTPTENCGGLGPCDPPLTCIDDMCGECGNGETRACDEGCGPGEQSCNYATRSWGRCIPTEAVECDVNDDPIPRLACDHPCGTGYNPCSAVSCTFDRTNCIRADFNPGTQTWTQVSVSCTPGGAPQSCFFGPNLCRGTQT